MHRLLYHSTLGSRVMEKERRTFSRRCTSTQGPSWGYFNSPFLTGLSTFGDCSPQNGSKTVPKSQNRPLGYPHEGPFVVCATPTSQPRIYMRRGLDRNTSGNEVYYIACSLLVTLKTWSSKLHCPRGFNLNSFSYQVRETHFAT